jgi:hypothetical protein
MITLSLCSEECVKIAELEGVEPRECELSFLAYCAYGHTGRIFTSLVLSVELWFALVVGLVSIGVNGALLTNGALSQGSFIALATIIIFPLLDAPAWLLGLGGVCSLVGTGLCAAGFLDAAVEAWPQAQHGIQQSDDGFRGFNKFMSAAGIFVYTYGNAACLPPIRSEMASASKFPLVSAVAMLVSLIFYGVMGIAAIPFGSAIGQSYLANVTRSGVLTLSCLSIMVSFMFVMPLMTNPILLALLPLVGTQRPLLFKVAFSVISAGAAIFLQDYLAALSSLTGTCLTILCLVLLPASIYIRLVPGVGLPEKIFLVLVSLVSMVFLVLGTYVTAKDILA